MIELAFITNGVAVALAVGAATLITKFLAQRVAKKTLESANLDRLEDLDSDFVDLQAQIKLLRMALIALDTRMDALKAQNAGK